MSRPLQNEKQSGDAGSYNVPGTCTQQKSTPNHEKIPNTVTEGKQVGNVQIPGTGTGPHSN